MFRAIFDAFNFSTEVQESSESPRSNCIKEDHIDEDGWVNFQLQEGAESGDETFAFVETPEIMEMDEDGDDTEEMLAARATVMTPEIEAIKRREAYTQAKAKAAFRNHLESVMFADPESGKDVRTTKSTHGSARTGVSSGSNSIRRLNTQSQRAKKSSGKSNDRKTHKISELAA